MEAKSYIRLINPRANTSGLQKLILNDIMLSARTLFLADAYYDECYPSKADPVNNSTLTDLKTKTPLHVLTKAGAVTYDNVNKGFVMPDTAGNFFTVGKATDFPLTSFPGTGVVFIFWIKRQSNDNYGSGQLINRGTTNAGAANFQFLFGVGTASINPQGYISDGTNAVTVGLNSADVAAFGNDVNKTVQIGFAIENGKAKTFYNGHFSSESAALPGPLMNPNLPISIGKSMATLPNFRGIIKRYDGIYTTANAGETAVDIVAQEWAAYNARMRSTD